jgi:uncharacterized protein YjbI with pentapeptide repeats
MTDNLTPKRKAADNPWYRLATLHGEPTRINDAVVGQNRATWNRCIARTISDDLLASLLKAGYSYEELTPISDVEWLSVKERVGSGLSTEVVDFTDVEIESLFLATGFIFPPLRIGGAVFTRYADFSKATFTSWADFSLTEFSGRSVFRGATFMGTASFIGSEFCQSTDFIDVTFKQLGYFRGARFYGGGPSFQEATFGSTAYFVEAVLNSPNFRASKFTQGTDFRNAIFASVAYFSAATFDGKTDFRKATFTGDTAFFDKAVFADQVDFCNTAFRLRRANFENAEFRSKTDFTNARFAAPPDFSGAALHEATVWRDVNWPTAPKNRGEAETFVDAYKCLKREMERLKRHADELDFFALELRSQRVLLGYPKGLPIAVYGFLSNYGRSYIRPLALLAATVLLGAAFFAVHIAGFYAPLPGRAIGLSFANTFGVLGIRKDLVEPAVLQCLPGWLKVIASVQTAVGIVALFLLGLGIRNHFRMK